MGYTRIKRYNKIRNQKKEIPVSNTPLTITSQVEDIKDSPNIEQKKRNKREGDKIGESNERIKNNGMNL
jgi:hypothetical protein